MEIPSRPASRPITLDDKPLFDRLFEQLQPRVSELAFAGLYLFRIAHGYQLSRIGESIVVSGRGYDGSRYCMPPMGGDVAAACTRILESGRDIYGADESFLARYLNTADHQIEELRDSFDYLYLREELALLPGNRFHKKKNRINYFTARHSYTVHVLSARSVPGCLALLDEWRGSVQLQASISFEMELDATAEALKEADALGLSGVVVEVDGRVRAFAVGERLNQDTAVCHFEKADPFMEGLSQLVNREFCRMLFTDCRYINREQDLGEPGLRNAKLSYHPVELVKKYMVRKNK